MWPRPGFADSVQTVFVVINVRDQTCAVAPPSDGIGPERPRLAVSFAGCLGNKHPKDRKMSHGPSCPSRCAKLCPPA